MQLPNTIKIGGHTYKVIFPYIFKERLDLQGQHDFAVKEIRLASVDMANQERVTSDVYVTFIHEVLHAIDAITGHHIFENNENAIEGFSECLYQILVDNEWIEKKLDQ